jgi:guanylate kinase
LDINGANQVNKLNYPANYIGILPPSLEILKERLIGRGTDSKEVIEKRVNIGVSECEEIQKSNYFSCKIVNDDVVKAYNEFKSNIFDLYTDIDFKL